MSPKNSLILDGASAALIIKCAEALRAGELVVIPTETVYGLAAIASSPLAVKKVFAMKNRPAEHPLILHIADSADLDEWAVNVSDTARKLCEKFWPGPLTVIVNRSNKVCNEITGGRNNVAVRCPNHQVAHALLKELNDAVVAPSANKFGKVSPTCAQHVLDDLGNESPMILDGGECSIGIESTIVDCTVDPPQLLRAGAITAVQIMSECAIKVDLATGESRAPGMLEKHYAPNCQVQLVDNLTDAQKFINKYQLQSVRARVLDLTSDLPEYARQLYSRLRQADFDKIEIVIAVRAPPNGLGMAINERLEKAANSSI